MRAGLYRESQWRAARPSPNCKYPSTICARTIPSWSWKLDRLARSLRQLLDTVEVLHARQIRLRSLTEAIDTSTPGGTLVFHLFGALAEFERSIIRERTRA